MSRLANYPLKIPAGLKVEMGADVLSVQGAKSKLDVVIHPDVAVNVDEAGVHFRAKETLRNKALVGTMYALARNALIGLSE